MQQWSKRLTYLCALSYFNLTIISTIHVATSTQPVNQGTLDQDLKTTCLQVTNTKAVNTLLMKGANPLAKDENGNNCFHLLVKAASNGEQRNTEKYLPLIQLLFDHSVPSQQQLRSHTPLQDYLINELDLLKFIYPKELIGIIAQLANHYPSTQQNSQGQTPLHIILSNPTPNTSLAKLFIESGFICIHMKDVRGHLPDQCLRPSLPPAQVQHYDKTRTEIVEVITRTRNS